MNRRIVALAVAGATVMLPLVASPAAARPGPMSCKSNTELGTITASAVVDPALATTYRPKVKVTKAAVEFDDPEMDVRFNEGGVVLIAWAVTVDGSRHIACRDSVTL